MTTYGEGVNRQPETKNLRARWAHRDPIGLMSTGDPYAVLGVPTSATPAEIRAAYETKVNAAAKTGHVAVVQRIDAAYEVLRNPQLRREYDRTGRLVTPPRIAWRAAPRTPGRNWSPAEPRRQRGAARRHRSLTALLPLILALVLVGAGWRWGLLPGAHAHAQAFAGDMATQGLTGTAPAPRALPHGHRLLPAPVAPAGAGGFTLMNGSARWDPCLQVHYVVGGAEPWPGANAMLSRAIAEVGRDTGLEFVDDGTTSEPTFTPRAPYQRARYGDRWAPVLIAWSDAASTPRLAGNVLGIGGATPATVAGHSRLVSGLVFYDAPDLSRIMSSGSQGAEQVRITLLHELGHLVGLAHVPDAGSVMYVAASGRLPGFSAGDLRGLAFAGSGSCYAFG